MFFPSPFFTLMSFHSKEAPKTEILIKEPIFYDNPENLSQTEIDLKVFTLCPWRGPNSEKRIKTLESYSSLEISKEEWIEKYTSKF